VSYEALAGATCPMAATGTPVTPVDAGSYCVYVQATGNYSGSAAGTLVVSPALADVSIDGAVAGLVQRDFDGLPQIVTATSLPTVDGFVVTYDGAPTAPSAAGSYSVLATVDDPNYTGSASATLVISTA